jgi:DNA (cytosine-5)-methyltransferase 1
MSFLLDNKKIELNNMDNNNSIVCNIEEMDLTKLSKQELLVKCEELGITKCKSKNKSDLIDLITSKMQPKKKVELIIEDDNIIQDVNNEKLLYLLEDDKTTNEIITTNLENNNDKILKVGITKCKSKNKGDLINSKMQPKKKVELIIEDDDIIQDVNNEKLSYLLEDDKTSNEIITTNLENNNDKILKVGTLFSGIGAFEHALDRLSIKHKIVFACDIDSYVKKSYFENYKIQEDDWYDDVLKLNATKYINENIDIIVGGSPCQSFSFVGKQKGLEDDRGNLIFEFIRVVKECKPKMFIFENVKGLTTHESGKTFKYVLLKFNELDYNISYNILKATDYGIPQSRQRLFLIGINKNTNVTINFPPPKLELTLKMQDLLEDNVNTQYYLQQKGQEFAVKDINLTKKYTQINGEIALCQKKNQQFNWHGDFVFEYRDIPDKYYLSDSVRDYVLKSGTKGFNMKPEIDLQIARPILSSVHKMHRAGVDNYVTKYGKLRKLTPRECLRLMGFSDNFKIVVSDTRMYQQAGNSIVVNVLMEIIKNISNLY